MFGSTTLEVAIGLIFLFLMLSLLMSSAREILEAWLQSRAAHLERGIRELLDDRDGTGFAKQLYDHPLIAPCIAAPTIRNMRPPILLVRTGDGRPLRRASNLPAYIPARNFAVALLDLARQSGAGPAALDAPPALDQIRSSAANIANDRVRGALLVAIDHAKGDLDEARANLENWYDSAMDRVSGWYRKQTQWILFGGGLLAAVALNIDTIHIAQELYRNNSMRSVIVAEAEALVQQSQAAGLDPSNLSAVRAALGCPETETAEALASGQSCPQMRLSKLGVPIGWSVTEAGRLNFRVSSIPGWLITALAIALGAPFWFDVLNKVMVIRSTVKPHEKSPEESSEDRQSKPAVPQPAPATRSAPAGLLDQSPGGVGGTADDDSLLAQPAPGPEDDLDCCTTDLVSTEPDTPDEELPPAVGGVAGDLVR
jgi:hypothetical protein